MTLAISPSEAEFSYDDFDFILRRVYATSWPAKVGGPMQQVEHRTSRRSFVSEAQMRCVTRSKQASTRLVTNCRQNPALI